MNDHQEQFQQLREIVRRIERDAMSPFHVCLFWLLGWLSILVLILLMKPYLTYSVFGFLLTASFLFVFFLGVNLLSMIGEGRSTWRGAFMVALASYRPIDHVSYGHLSNALIDSGVDVARVNMWLIEEGDRVAKRVKAGSPHRKSEYAAVKRLKAKVGRE